MTNRFKLLTLLFVISLHTVVTATTRRVLFIGNSYIYTNNMPLMLQSLTTALGDTLIYDQSTVGGYTFNVHSTYAPTIAKIYSQQWDLVVLQEQSQLPSFDPTDVATQVYPYAHILDSLIRDNDSCTQTMFMMTWGRQYGDMSNCPFYTPVCTYEGMQIRLRDSYMQMTQDNNAVVAPVGAAWKVARDSFPAIALYMADSSHPVVGGSYLEACVLYASIFHKKTYGATYLAGLPLGDARSLQHVADKVVLDSISQWQMYGHYPYAGFMPVFSGSTLTAVPLSPIGTLHNWDFGDGGVSTGITPVHNYTSGGTYVVTHTVYTSCFTETFTDTFTVSTTAVGNTTGSHDPAVRILQLGGGNVTFELASPAYKLKVYDEIGRVVKDCTSYGNAVSAKLAPGIYLYRVSAADGSDPVSGKFIVQ